MLQNFKIKFLEEKTINNNKIKVLANENNKLLKRTELLQEENSVLKEELNNFCNFNHYYKLYSSLNDESKNRLSQVFKTNNIENFVSCGVQTRNIEILWEIAKKTIISGNEADGKKITDILYFFIHINNLTYDRPMYYLIEKDENEEFDPHTHFSLGLQSGKIKEVLLKGYKDRTGKVIKKSIVNI